MELNIAEYQILELDNDRGGKYYSIEFSNGSYYITYEEDRIKTTNRIGFAARYLDKEKAEGEMRLIQKHYTPNGVRKERV